MNSAITKNYFTMTLLIILYMSKPVFCEATVQKASQQLQNEIARAQVCKKKSDCKGPISLCPFGCNIYVNKKDYSRIEKLMIAASTCEYGCTESKGYDCIKGKCQAVK